MKFSEVTKISSVTHGEISHRFIDASGSVPGKNVLLLHGLGDHIACHDWAADLLYRAGFSPEGFDWPGHGKSSGRRGDIPGVNTAVQLVDEIIKQMKTPPVGVFSHSTGGFIILRYLDEKLRCGEKIPFRWVWLSSPLLCPEHNQSELKQHAAKWLGQFLPRLTFSTGVGRDQCCHMENAEKDDPRINFDGCHNRVSLRYGNSILDSSRKGFYGGIPLGDPLRILLSQGDGDPICPPRIAMDFFRKTPAKDKTFILVKGARHEAFREEKPQSFFNSVSAWLENC